MCLGSELKLHNSEVAEKFRACTFITKNTSKIIISTDFEVMTDFSIAHEETCP